MAQREVKAGWYVHYHQFHCEPADLWGVIERVSAHHFYVRMLDTGEVEFTELDMWDAPDSHCTTYPTPPDAFFVWQAKRALGVRRG